MDTLVGVLLDVSASMRKSIGERPNQENGSWARSIFRVVDSLIKHDVSSSNHVFALGCGARTEPHVFDLLGTVKANTETLPLPYRVNRKVEIVEELVNLIQKNFYIHSTWVCKDVLMEVLTKSDACLFVVELKDNPDFKRKFPSMCDFKRWNPSLEITLSPREKAKEVVRLVRRSLTAKILEEILNILEMNGAPRVRTWANMEVLLDVIERSEARFFLKEIKRNRNFTRKFVEECLPEACKTLELGLRSIFYELFNFGAKYVPHAQEYATRESVEEVVAKGKNMLLEESVWELVPISPTAIMNVREASEILHGGLDEDELTDERVDEMMTTVEPLIYGRTPLMTTIARAKELFDTERFKGHKKLVFIISDGMPTDGDDPPIKELVQLGVTSVCCYITENPIADPKRLYSTESETWCDAAKLMFRMSSPIPTQMIPRTIFVKRGWTIDITNNETRLFAQVNHPDIIEDVCNFARDVVFSQDALSDVFSSVSLDLYINQANQGFHPKQQVSGTCYANAAAAVMHLSMKRIVGRDNFFDLRKEMIQKYGEDGANTFRVLGELCPKYRLRYKVVNTLGALTAVSAKRPVLARFWLTDPEWAIFSNFYMQSPRGVLTSDVLDIKLRPTGAETIGHAVVLTSYNSECLTLMNSWGSNWGNGGFFKVANADVLGLEFVDVFWTIDDLMQSEIEAYDRYGASIAQEMFSKLQGLQKMDYICPLCNERSNVNEFSGNHLEAKCPKCHQQFRIKEAGDDLALNMYLLSLTSDRR